MSASRRGTHGAIAAILLLALAARLWAIDYGLPWLFYFHDEPQVVLRALRFGTGDLNPHFFIWPGTLLLELAFAAYGSMYLVGRLAGAWSGPEGFAAAYFRDPTWFYLLPRLQSVAFGVWGVWLAHRLGSAAGSTAAGLAAALALALNAPHAHFSHFAHPVTWMTAFTLLGLWASVRAAQDGARRDFLMAGAALGLGVACQYHAGLLAVPIVVAALVQWRAGRPRALLDAAFAGTLGVALYFAISPYSLLDWQTFTGDLRWITAKTESGIGRQGADPAGLWTLCLGPGLGAPLAIAGAAGAARAAWRRRPADLVLVAYVAAYLLLLSRAGTLTERYAIPLVAPLAVLAALALGEALTLARVPAVRHAPALVALVGLLCLPQALSLAETDWSMGRPDTREVSLAWFERNVPAGERVVIDMLRFWNTASPPLAENRERLLERLAEIRAGVSGAGHGAAYEDYFRFRLEHPREPGYYLRGTDMGSAAWPLGRYREEGFRWAVVSSHARRLQEARAAAGDSGGLGYYLALEREAREVARFEPAPWRRRGPEIRVYRIDAAPPGP